MSVASPVLEVADRIPDSSLRPSLDNHHRAMSMVYGFALLAAAALWFVAIRAPLSEDEAGTFRQIDAGFSQIWARQGISFPAYPWILWLSTKVLGTSEIALRVPSVLAMLAAMYLLYRIAREIFDWELALIAAVLFCANPYVVFASIDVRPYAFAVLIVNAAILTALRIRRSPSVWLAALLGLLAALVVWFHYLFGVILPALVIVFWAVRRDRRRATWKQFGVAMAAFVVSFVPVLPGIRYLFSTRTSHVFEQPPPISALIGTLVPGWVGPAVLLTAFYVLMQAGLRRKADRAIEIERWHVAVCLSLALLPALILYGVSVATPIHMFVERHRLVAVPGIVLCWTLLAGRFRYRSARTCLCLLLVGLSAWQAMTRPRPGQHMFSWKWATEAAEKNASADHAPVLMCSDYPEADYLPMPDPAEVKDSPLFATLSYYKLTVPVFAMPRALSDEAKSRGAVFADAAARRHQRFLAMAYVASYPTVDWLEQRVSDAYIVHKLGVFDGIEVVEFAPRSALTSARGAEENRR